MWLCYTKGMKNEPPPASTMQSRFPVGMVFRAPFGHHMAGETCEVAMHCKDDIVFFERHLSGGLNVVEEDTFAGWVMVYDPRYPHIFGAREALRVCRRSFTEECVDVLPGHWLYRQPRPIPLAQLRAAAAAVGAE